MAPSFSQALEDLRIGSDLSTESNVLAEIIRQTALKAGESNATHELGMGEVAETLTALRTGAIDLYPISADAIATHMLIKTSKPDLVALNRELAASSLSVSIPLVNKRNYVLAMSESIAASFETRTINDALGLPQLRFGLSPRFMRDEAGLKQLQKRGTKMTVVELDRYRLNDALKKKSVDVVDLDPTDPTILKYNLRVLEDDKRSFAAHRVVVLHRLDVPRRFPQTWERLQLLDNSLTEKILLTLNWKVESGSKKTPDAVAEFLSTRMPIAEEITSADTATPNVRSTAASKEYGDGLLRTTQRHVMLVLIALLMSIVAGVPLGALAYSQPRFGKFVRFAMKLMDIVPFLVVLVLCVTLLGTIGPIPALAALFLYGLIPIVGQTQSGLEQIPRDLRESAALQSLTGFARVRLLDLPLAMPAIAAGIQRCAVVNVGTVAIAALAGTGGYGEAIFAGLSEENYGQMLAGAIPAALLAIFLHSTFGLFSILAIFSSS